MSPEGWIFYVADMHADGVFLIDGEKFRELGFIATGIGTHGLYPSRDATKLYVVNRGSHRVYGPPHGRGSVSVLEFEIYKMETETSVAATWPIPGGGSPDMGNVSADGKQLWLSGRFDNVVYAIDTATGAVRSHPGRQRAARVDGVAATGPLLARSHREHAIAEEGGAMTAFHPAESSGLAFGDDRNGDMSCRMALAGSMSVRRREGTFAPSFSAGSVAHLLSRGPPSRASMEADVGRGQESAFQTI